MLGWHVYGCCLWLLRKHKFHLPGGVPDFVPAATLAFPSGSPPLTRIRCDLSTPLWRTEGVFLLVPSTCGPDSLGSGC